jgi:hypothetical protein
MKVHRPAINQAAFRAFPIGLIEQLVQFPCPDGTA